MCMLKLRCGNTHKEKMRNEKITIYLEISLTEEMRLALHGRVMRRLPTTPIRCLATQINACADGVDF